MIENIVNLDTKIFYFINVGLSNPITDFLMPIITNGKLWAPIYIFLFVYLIFLSHLKSDAYLQRDSSNYFKNIIIYNKSGIAIALLLAIAVILADQISANFIKNSVGRLRPCHSLDNINLLISCGSGKSFPSAHATNNFAAAVLLSHFYKKYKYIFFSLATLVAFSRVFVGVHYPFDILVGAILGSIISCVLIFVFNKFIKHKLDIK